MMSGLQGITGDIAAFKFLVVQFVKIVKNFHKDSFNLGLRRFGARQ
jgi:hypothetical protein